VVADVIRVVIAVAAMVLIIRVGIRMMRGMVQPPPDPEPGEMRRVSIRYRCSMCGTELRLTMAPDGDPPPPKHCQEEMDLVAPIDD